MYKLKLILRYLRARRITVIPIAAVAVAVFLLVVVLSVMNGFSAFIQEKIRGTLSDVIVEFDHVRGFEDYEAVCGRIASIDGVRAVSPHLSGKAVLTIYDTSSETRVNDFQCVFIGIDLDREDAVTGLRGMLQSPGGGFEWTGGGEALPGMIRGAQVLGGIVVVPDPGFRASLTTPLSVDRDQSKKFRSTGRFKSGLYDVDRLNVYIPLDAAQELTDLEGRVTSLHVRAEEGVNLDRLKTDVQAVLPDDDRFVVKTWMESEKLLIDATRLERIIWAVILSALLAVAGFCILAVMSLTVIQKRRDIGILRSIGAGMWGVLGTFVQYGLVVGFIGATLGLLAGYLVLLKLDPVEAFVLEYTGWTPWPRDVFYFNEIPREISPLWMFAFWAGGIAVSFLASLIPAARAARTDPVLTLRYEH